MNYSKIFLYGLGLVGALAINATDAHAKPLSADYMCPPRDEMCQLVDRSLRRMDQQPTAKPKAKPARSSAPMSSTYDDSWTRWTPEQNARAAVATVVAVRSADRQSLFNDAFALR